MKPITTFAILAILALTISGYSQHAFGVSPGLNLNGAYFGFKLNDKLLPYFSFQYLGAKYKLERSGVEDTQLSAALIIPSLGLKYFLNKQNQIQPYLNISLSKPFISGKLEFDGEEDEEFKDVVKNINLFGSEIGFGVEYFFDENFSIGGEYGVRILNLKYKASDEFDDINVKASISPTYSKLTLNFYFVKKEK